MKFNAVEENTNWGSEAYQQALLYICQGLVDNWLWFKNVAVSTIYVRGGECRF
jgi:hypothetical protein